MSQEFYERWDQLPDHEKKDIQSRSERMQQPQIGVVSSVIEAPPEEAGKYLAYIATLTHPDTDAFTVRIVTMIIEPQYLAYFPLMTPVYISHYENIYTVIPVTDLRRDPALAREVAYLQEEITRTAYGEDGRAAFTYSADLITLPAKVKLDSILH